MAVEERRALQEKQARLPGGGSSNASRGASRCLMMSSGGGREELAERIAEQALGGGLRSGSVHGSDASLSLAGGMGQASYSLAETTVCFRLALLHCNFAATRIQSCSGPFLGSRLSLSVAVCAILSTQTLHLRNHSDESSHTTVMITLHPSKEHAETHILTARSYRRSTTQAS